MSQNCGKLPPDNPHRHLPGVDTLLKQCPELLARWGHEQLTAALRVELAGLRTRIDAGEQLEVDQAAIRQAVADQLELNQRSSLQAVFNLTGTVLHTNLGRASLPEEAIDAVVCAARYPSNLEFDLKTGKRGNREDHIESLLCEFTGAEAATVVNNNAAAVLLVLNTLALGKQVPVSRGELVEIGGSFRIPEVMQRAGCKLLEIGATNRTHLKDYQRAITRDTALLLKVHTSNYRVEGFTSEVNERELAALANKHGLPFVIDLGSGNLIEFSALGLPKEQTAADAINSGADLITFSGDKLLGGPQAGLIAGRADLIAQVNNNPLKRALRLDKMTLAALAAVLKLYRNPQTLPQRLPTLRQLTRPVTDIQAMAQRLQPAVAAALTPQYGVSVVSSSSQIGSGALPVDTLPSASLRLLATDGDDAKLRLLAAALRGLPKPVIGRIHKGALLLDLRCLEDEADFINQLPQWGVALA